VPCPSPDLLDAGSLLRRLQFAQPIPAKDPPAVTVVPVDPDSDAACLLDPDVLPAIFLAKDVEEPGLRDPVDAVASTLCTGARLPKRIERKDGHVVVRPLDVEALHLYVDLDTLGGNHGDGPVSRREK